MLGCVFMLATVTCAIMQKTGAGFHSASSCYWDNTTDGMTPCSDMYLVCSVLYTVSVSYCTAQIHGSGTAKQ